MRSSARSASTGTRSDSIGGTLPTSPRRPPDPNSRRDGLLISTPPFVRFPVTVTGNRTDWQVPTGASGPCVVASWLHPSASCGHRGRATRPDRRVGGWWWLRDRAVVPHPDHRDPVLDRPLEPPAVGVVVALVLLQLGGCGWSFGSTTSVNVFTASGATPLLAVTVIGNEPAVVGVPDSTPSALMVMPPATVAGVEGEGRRRRTRDAGEGEAVRRPHACPTRGPGEVRGRAGVLRRDLEGELLHRVRSHAVGRSDRDRERARRRSACPRAHRPR